jgi:uncharacterized membrane protein (UPF0127 family)
VRLLLLIAVAACSSSNGRQQAQGDDVPGSDVRTAPGPTVTFETPTGAVVVQAEVVSTPARIQQGLMYREHLPLDGGMLFLMGRDEDWSFYMRNTLIPLDMIFITRDMTVAGVAANTKPRTETLHQIGKPSLYVLEVNAGWAAKHQVAAGTKVRFDRVPMRN